MPGARDAAAWIFQDPPETFRGWTSGREELVGPTSWPLANAQGSILPGQPVFIWRSGAHGGFVASGRIDAAPFAEIAFDDAPARQEAGRPGLLSNTARWWVDMTIGKRFAPGKFSRARLREHPVLKSQRPICPIYLGSHFAMGEDCLAALEALLT